MIMETMDLLLVTNKITFNNLSCTSMPDINDVEL